MKEVRKLSLLLADVDGTLVTHDKILTERAQRAVHRMREVGIRFAITSGRPPKGMAMLIAPLAIETPIAGFNGGLCVHPDLSIIEERTLDSDVAAQTVALMHDHGLDVWVYAGNDWLVRDPKVPHVDREAWTVKFPPKVVKDFGSALQRAVKIVGVSDDLELVKRCEADAQRALGSRASAARSQPYYLDVTHHDANKGFVAEVLARSLQIPFAEIATIGDQPNDVLMFKRSGLSIAMGNSSDDVKRQADAVTDSYDNEGFANAVERFILGRVAHA
ncbi:Cof-type HAD-IIB family hydrolase [Steroidobacter cummioxidans]|uniref:Cof-type HAD-IIB family hydrolase n=1 Tax=Steroidobacter cummioxidans TaxID=1803913 RepID=UPI000E31ECCA|nr:Cof-type HAD-IIB family hydrolase [Steroidobacter cummioxidans]